MFLRRDGDRLLEFVTEHAYSVKNDLLNLLV